MIRSISENSCCENFKMFPRKPQWQSPLRGHPLSMYAKFSKKLPFLTPWYAHVRVRIWGVRNVSFSENFAYVLNGWPLTVTFQLKYSQELNVIPAFTKYKILRYSTCQKTSAQLNLRKLYRVHCGDILNLFQANVPHLHLLKTPKNPKIFWCFQGVQNRKTDQKIS